ncbi:MAG: GNAT family N-acetyltransferase [Cellulosilyticaceae bacterium]
MRIKETLVFEDFVQMYGLEALYYTEEHITPAEESYRWYQQHPYSVCALEDGGKIMAFINLFPIGEDLFEQIKSGTFNDKELKAEQLVDIRQPVEGTVHMFLCCIVIHEDYRGQGVLKQLLQEASRPYEGIQIECMITDNVTPEGERLSRKLGMQYVRETVFESVIYMGDYKRCIAQLKAV